MDPENHNSHSYSSQPPAYDGRRDLSSSSLPYPSQYRLPQLAQEKAYSADQRYTHNTGPSWGTGLSQPYIQLPPLSSERGTFQNRGRISNSNVQFNNVLVPSHEPQDDQYMPPSTRSPLPSISSKRRRVNTSDDESSHISQPPSPAPTVHTSVAAADRPPSAMSTTQSAGAETFSLSTANSAAEGRMCREVQFQRVLVDEHEHSGESLKHLNTFSKLLHRGTVCDPETSMAFAMICSLLLKQDRVLDGIRSDIDTMSAEFKSISGTIKATWSPSKDQTAAVMKIIKHLYIQPHRTEYVDVWKEAYDYAAEHREEVGFPTTCFEELSPARSRLQKLFKDKSNSVKGHLRTLIINALAPKGPTRATIHEFAKDILTKFSMDAVPYPVPEVSIFRFAMFMEYATASGIVIEDTDGLEIEAAATSTTHAALPAPKQTSKGKKGKGKGKAKADGESSEAATSHFWEGFNKYLNDVSLQYTNKDEALYAYHRLLVEKFSDARAIIHGEQSAPPDAPRPVASRSVRGISLEDFVDSL